MKKFIHLKFVCSVLLILCIIPWGFSQIPKTPTVQILLTDNTGNPVSDGSYTITVSLYTTTSGGTAAWSETQSVAVSSGLANLVLGTSTPLTIVFDKQYYAGVKIGTGMELTPRLALNPSTYSISARAVYGTDNIFPETGDVGIGTLTPQAKLDIEGKLRIADVPVVDTMMYVLVHDSLDDKIVKAMRLDT
ncbi:MAG: hypothetical protein HQ541_18340, partial [Mariniphaga sp.]|nr:hypothetical protein [Mariniphaga sp.]